MTIAFSLQNFQDWRGLYAGADVEQPHDQTDHEGDGAA